MTRTKTALGAIGAAVALSASIWGIKAITEPSTAARIFDRMVKDLESRKKNDPIADRGNNTTYDLLNVQVEDWLATEEGRFAHSIKIPNPVPEDSGYKKGMTQQEYFEHLCKTEAGEFVFKTTEDVNAIYQMRGRKRYKQYELQHLYAIEDPYGHAQWEVDDPALHFLHPLLYSYFEIPVADRRLYGPEYQSLVDRSLMATPPADAVIARYFGYDNRSGKSTKLEFDSRPKSRYGFTWRGIRRPHDREMGIAGGELIVLDLTTKEVMGVRRGYAIWNRRWTARVCPFYGYSGGEDKTTYHSAIFVAKVARPSRWQEFFKEKENGRVQRKS